MKLLLLSLLIAVPLTSFSASSFIKTDEDYKKATLWSENPQPPKPAGYIEKQVDCPNCLDQMIQKISDANKRSGSDYDLLNKARREGDSKKAAEIEKSIAQGFSDSEKYMSELKSERIKFLEKKLEEAEKKTSQCKDTKDSLTVNDSNRSFFGKISEIFSWKRDTPAPVEDRSTGLSK